MVTQMENEILLIYDELCLDGCGIIGKRRKDGRWDSKTYRILKELRKLASRDGISVEFDTKDGSVTLIPIPVNKESSP